MSTSHAKFALRGIARRSLLVASLSLASSVVRAQTPKPFQVNCGLSAAPSVVGQWSGPYDLTQITSEHATPTKPLAEITHAAVLPNGGGVLMWCRMTTLDPNAHGGNFGPTHTWLWNPASPTNVTKLDVPNPFDGSKDIWCGGHNWRDDGKLVAFGGSDLRFPPSPGVPWTGTFGAFAFDPASPGWTALPDLTKPRWYPTGFPCPDSVFRVFGTYGLPAEFPPGSGEAPADYADRFLTAGTWEKKLNMLSDPNCVELSPISFDPVTTLNYPACFLLAKGKKIFGASGIRVGEGDTYGVSAAANDAA